MPIGDPARGPGEGPVFSHLTHRGTGPAALLVHGFLTGGVYWEPNLAAISSVCRPVVVDLWGHGRSPTPDDRSHYDPPGVVAAFERLRSRLAIDRWVVIGHSLGAALSLHYALAHPDRVAGLVITNSNSAFPHANEERRVRASLRLAEQIDELGMAAFDDHPLNPSVSKRLPDASRAALIEAYGRHDPVGLGNMLRWTTPFASAADRLGDLVVPTLLTWGVHERRFGPGADLAKARIPNLQVAELQAGHPVNLQDQDGFDTAVVDFISALS